MTAVRLFMFVEHMNRYHVDPGWLAGMFVLLSVWIRKYYLSSIHYEVVISPWCAVQIHYNGDGGCAFMHVRWMYGTVSCWTWTSRKYVCIGVFFNLKLLFVLEAVWGRNFALMCCPNTYNGDDGYAFMLVECMARCRVGPGRAGSTFALVCSWICSCYIRVRYSMRS